MVFTKAIGGTHSYGIYASIDYRILVYHLDFLTRAQ